MQQPRWRPVGSALVLFVAAAATSVTLLATRPRLDLAPALHNGDDLAVGAVWIVAIACAAWLTLTSAACVIALVGGRPGIAVRIARCGPPLLRGIVPTALAGTFAVMPTAAFATPHTPAAPLVVHVSPGGRLTVVPGASRPVDTPVVRTPPATTRPPAPSTTTTHTTAPAAPTAPAPTVHAPVAAPRAPAPAPVRGADGAPRTYVVQAGDNLWRIAQAEAARATGVARPDNPTVAEYWERVIATNRTTLRSGDPSLIFPGEIVALPSF